jgi:uncharacterized membrane protein
MTGTGAGDNPVGPDGADVVEGAYTTSTRPLVGLFLLCLLAFVYMLVMAISEWRAGLWHLEDVGNIQYCLVNTWYGDFMYSPLASCNHFALHYTPLFFLFLPLVWLSSYAIPLVGAYQLALALTPVPLYMLARQYRLGPWVGLALGIWFLGNHFVGSLQLSNHFEAFFVLFGLLTMALMRSRSSVAFWICAVLALSVKEDCAIWLLAYACWEWLFHRQEPLVRRRALKLAWLSILWGITAGIIMYIAALGEDTNAMRYANRMGGISLGWDTALMLMLIFLTSGGLALLNWRTALLLLVIPLPVILGNFEITRTLKYYYSYPFLPFLGLVTVAGVARLVDFVRKRWPMFVGQLQFGLVLFLIVLGTVQFTIKTRTNNHYRIPHKSTPRDGLRRELATDKLPADAPVALQHNLWGVVPWRKDVVLLSAEELQDHHWVFMDLFVPSNYAPDELQRLADRLTHEIESGRRKEIYRKYEFLILSPASDTTTSGSEELP